MSTDRNLLFGILALQADFIHREQFVEACAAWASRKDVPLAGLLVERGWLSASDRQTVERLLERKLAKHAGDMPATLAAVADAAVQESLAGVADAAIQQSLAGSPTLLRTIAYTAESHDRYTVTRLHAKGGLGQVWLARDHDLGRDVALKDLRPEAAHDPKVAARFLEEAQITGQLEHPNIVPVYELARRTQAERPYYTMRFVHGRTFGQAIRAFHERRNAGTAGPLEFRELINQFTDICNAVTYAHSRGVIHRDLKPQNVVLGDFGEVVLLDWGLAKLVGGPDRASEAPPIVVERVGVVNPTVQGQVLGTPAYMAPEQAEGRLDLIDVRTDVYGLGAILYEVLSGKPPFPGSDTQEVLERVRLANPESPKRSWSRVPRALVAICQRAMAKRQADRYAGASEVGAEVERWLGNEPVSAYAEPFSERAARWLRRYPAFTAAAMTFLAAAVLTLGAGLILLNESSKQIDTQRELAERNHIESLLIIQSTLGSLEGQIEKAPVPGMQPFQKELLQKLIQYIENLTPEYRETERVQQALASANYRMGKVCQEIGTLPEAMQSLNKALDYYLTVKPAENNPTAYHDRIARCHFSIGQTHLSLGDPAAAVEPLKKSIALSDEQLQNAAEANRRWRELDRKHSKSGRSSEPNRTSWTTQELLAWELTYLAIAESRTGRPDDALRSFARARELFHELLKDEFRSIETYPYFPNGLGFCLHHQAQLEQQLGRSTAATATYQSAIEHCRRAITLQQEKPKANNKAIAQFQSVLGHALTYYGTHLAERGQSNEAAAAYNEAVTLLEALHRDNPTLLAGQARLALAQANLGHLLVQTGQLEPAEANLRKALELTDLLANGPPRATGDVPGEVAKNPESMDGRAAAAWALNGLGQLQLKRGEKADALKTLRQAIAVGEQSARHAPVHRYQLAGAQALAGSLSEDQAEARRLSDQSFDSLREAIRLGYRNSAWFERDAALEPIRSRPEFQQLLIDLKK